ncbi:MAG: XdhC family protein [Candidatus Marinimicrobia bacterium]|nr:XdhC family protein [Candidatus Neomarinimicrobiota bacterium]
MSHWLEKAAELRAKGTPFAIATVVDAVAPTSAKPGAKAIINAQGNLYGWIGGGCTQAVIIEEALDCIQVGAGRLIRLSPDVEPSANHSVKQVAMRCESGGTLEVYIEPVLPKMTLLIFGAGPAAEALAGLAAILDYEITVFAPGAEALKLPSSVRVRGNFEAPPVEGTGPSIAVIATQGNGDEQAIKAALTSGAGYVTMVTSRTKATSLFAGLEKHGLSGDALAKIKVPAGLDIKAVTPGEIAVSVLAEIIQEARTKGIGAAGPAPLASEATEKVKDPVCEMIIDPRTAAGSSEFEGTTYHFCSLGCLDSFEADPRKYLLEEA